jgi:hypothetical protein
MTTKEVRMLKKIFREIRALYKCLSEEKSLASTHAGSPALEMTLEDIERLDPEDPFLVVIAIRHHDPTIAGAAAECVKPRRSLRMIARSPEASNEARIVAIGRLKFDEELFVELAIRDDDPVVALFAAQHVKSREWIPELRRSKYETVRLVIVTESDDPELLRHMLEDPCPEICARAELRLRQLIDGPAVN